VRLVENVPRVREKRGPYRVVVRKPGRKRPLGRPRLRLEDKLKFILRKEWTGFVWFGIGTSGELL
jgi:hypothetical protein